MAKSKFLAYVFWVIGGFGGLHHFYLGRDRHAFLYWSTFGNYFLGWIADLWRMPKYVAEVNETPEYIKTVTDKMRATEKPPFDTGRFLSQVLLAKWYGMAIEFAIPLDPVIYDWDLTFLKYILVPIGYAAGIHLIGNIGPYEGGMRAPLLGAYVSYPIVAYFKLSNFFTASVAAYAFHRRESKWRRTPRIRRHVCRRMLVLGVCGVFLLATCIWGLYWNGEVTEKSGEKVKIRDAVKNFFTSPLWIEFKTSLLDLWNFAQYHGWGAVWERLVEHMDPQGKQHAFKVLGLNESSSETEITNRYRKLSREWHPDKHKDPEKKREAQERFMEIQQAYETISSTKGSRSAKNKKE